RFLPQRARSTPRRRSLGTSDTDGDAVHVIQRTLMMSHTRLSRVEQARSAGVNLKGLNSLTLLGIRGAPRMATAIAIWPASVANRTAKRGLDIELGISDLRENGR